MASNNRCTRHRYVVFPLNVINNVVFILASGDAQHLCYHLCLPFTPLNIKAHLSSFDWPEEKKGLPIILVQNRYAVSALKVASDSVQ